MKHKRFHKFQQKTLHQESEYISLHVFYFVNLTNSHSLIP